VTDTEVFLVREFQREMAGLLSHDTAKEVCVWFKARDYQILGETIYPRHLRERGPRWVYPLTNSDLFLSFASLGGKGKPFEEQVLDWVRQNGLLRRKDYSDYSHRTRSHRTKDGDINHQPTTLRRFRDEVTLANNALRLLKQIRGGNYDRLRARIKHEPIYVPDPERDSGYYGSKGRKTGMAFLVMDGIETQEEVWADEPPSDDVVREWATQALEYLVERKLTKMGQIFTQDTAHPRPLSTILGEVPYRPRLTPRCPDLETALWFQFASLIGDKRPLRECSDCDKTFVGPQHKKTCSPRCRQRRKRRLDKERGS
jgi:hypothetical protein